MQCDNIYSDYCCGLHCEWRTIASAPHCDCKTIAVACIVTGGPLRTVSCKDSQSLQLSPHRLLHQNHHHKNADDNYQLQHSQSKNIAKIAKLPYLQVFQVFQLFQDCEIWPKL